MHSDKFKHNRVAAKRAVKVQLGLSNLERRASLVNASNRKGNRKLGLVPYWHIPGAPDLRR